MFFDESCPQRAERLAKRFNGRVDRQLVADVIDYVEFSECSLAFEILCDQLYEYDTPITSSEYEEFENIAKLMEIDRRYVTTLQSLIIPQGEA